MAAKKKTAAKKPVAKAKTVAPAKARAAVKLLTSLPPLDERRRRVYRAAFSDEQCDAWGKRTKAENVEGEAERFVGTLDSILKKGDVGGYSRYRLSWLCHLVGELNDAIDNDGAGGMDSARTERAAAGLEGLRWINSVQLIKALGGGWDASELPDLAGSKRDTSS